MGHAPENWRWKRIFEDRYSRHHDVAVVVTKWKISGQISWVIASTEISLKIRLEESLLFFCVSGAKAIILQEIILITGDYHF